MRKRSRTVALTILGAASFAIAGCRDEQVQAEAFPDLATCEAQAKSEGLFTVDQCTEAFAQAETLHVESARAMTALPFARNSTASAIAGQSRIRSAMAARAASSCRCWRAI